jgi:hypothetical protein
MFRALCAFIASWVGSLRGIVERHPAVFSVSAGPVSQGNQAAPARRPAPESSRQ